MEQLFQILNFLISYVFCPPLIMSHIFREHLLYIEVYNREYAGIPLSGQFIQVCPTIYVSIPISKMTIIILQVCEIYRIEQFSSYTSSLRSYSLMVGISSGPLRFNVNSHKLSNNAVP